MAWNECLTSGKVPAAVVCRFILYWLFSFFFWKNLYWIFWKTYIRKSRAAATYIIKLPKRPVIWATRKRPKFVNFEMLVKWAIWTRFNPRFHGSIAPNRSFHHVKLRPWTAHDLSCYGHFLKTDRIFRIRKNYAKFEIFRHFLRFCGAFFKFGNFDPSSKKAYNLTNNAPFEVAVFGNKSWDSWPLICEIATPNGDQNGRLLCRFCTEFFVFFFFWKIVWIFTYILLRPVLYLLWIQRYTQKTNCRMELSN